MKNCLLLVLSLFFLFSTGVNAQYGGSGSFGKINSLADLEAGTYYVLYGVNGEFNGAMGNTLSGGRFAAVDVIMTDGNIVDPSASIVWKVGGDATNGYTLYNEEVQKYCEVTENSTSGFALEATALGGYSATYDETKGFILSSKNADVGGRGISLYKTDFRPYSSTNTLHLYKLGHIAEPPTGTLELTVPNGGEAYTAGETVQLAWNSTDVANVYFEVWTDDLEWVQITDNIASVDGANTYDFTIPANAWTWDGYKIKVVDASASSINDESDAVFTITGHDTELLWCDFVTDLAPWTAISLDVSGTAVWSANDFNGTHAIINGYNAGANEDWLISPVIDMDNTIDEVIEFVSASKYGNNDGLVVKYSTNYNGEGDPSTATWIDFTGFTLGDGSDAWINSGTVDMGSISGNVHIAFVYTCTADNATRWRVTDIWISGVNDSSTGIDIGKENAVKVSPNPFTNELRIEGDNVVAVTLYNAAGQLVKDMPNVGTTIPTAELSKGMYILQVKLADGTITTQKVIKK